MTVILLPSPELQFCDAIGAPYAAGTIETYIPGTTTPKQTWLDPAGGDSHLNTNPIVLDAAGRCIIYADGAVRLVLADASGNLVFDGVSSTVVSAAMAPVVGAPTIADAVVALGIQDLIDASVLIETNRAEAAEATLTTNLANEVTARTNADATLTTNLANEVTRAEAAESNLQSQIDTITSGVASAQPVVTARQGSATSDAFGLVTINFVPAFGTRMLTFTVVDSHAVCVGTLYLDTAGGPGTPPTNTHITGMLACDAGGGAGGVMTPSASFDWYSTGY